jgi:hypothetical protein
MWLHHRDMNVSGKLRCPGKLVADDAMLALPSDPRSGMLFPMTGTGVGKSQIPGTHSNNDAREFRSSDFSSHMTVN